MPKSVRKLLLHGTKIITATVVALPVPEEGKEAHKNLEEEKHKWVIARD